MDIIEIHSVHQQATKKINICVWTQMPRVNKQKYYMYDKLFHRAVKYALMGH